jgi:uncharacterized protein with PIN domain
VRGRISRTSRDIHSWTPREAEFRFYEELNDFLPPERRKRAFRQQFQGTPAVLDLIQAIGVPHMAVDLVLVDGRSVGFGTRLHGGERVAVYPVFERLDISPLVHLRPRPLRRTRFALDVHLGRLARDLRLLGFDSTYRRDWEDSELIGHALDEGRIILTRDVGLLKHRRVTHGYWLRNDAPDRQLDEIVEALDLARQARPFSRCRECNGEIEPLAGESLGPGVDPAIRGRFERFWRCRDCRRVYWRGSHYQRLLRRVRKCVPGAIQEVGDASTS